MRLCVCTLAWSVKCFRACVRARMCMRPHVGASVPPAASPISGPAAGAGAWAIFTARGAGAALPYGWRGGGLRRQASSHPSSTSPSRGRTIKSRISPGPHSRAPPCVLRAAAPTMHSHAPILQADAWCVCVSVCMHVWVCAGGLQAAGKHALATAETEAKSATHGVLRHSIAERQEHPPACRPCGGRGVRRDHKDV